MYESIDERLTKADVAIGNAIDDAELAGPLAEFGYDAERMQEGQSLLEAARSLHRTRTKDYGQKRGSSEDLQQALDHANALYMQQVKLARLCMQDDAGSATMLGLIGRRKQSVSGWIEQASTFYTNALSTPEVMEALSRYNVTEADLQEGRDRVDAVAALNRTQEKHKGAAQQVTSRRNEAMKALDAWMGEFRGVARIAFADDPQALEKLQIHAPS
jgi:hypothetical protein